MARVIIYPYKLGSKSCRDIVRSLRDRSEYKILRVHGDGNYRRRANDVIINWGNSEQPEWDAAGILNDPAAVAVAVNKLSTLESLEEAGVSHVPFTKDVQEALDWEDVFIVVRHKLEGHSGEGIEMFEGLVPPHAPLYTRFIPKSVEYRVHVFQGEVIDYTKKIKRIDGEIKSRIKDDRVRSHANGWEYIRDVAPRESVKELAIAAVEALGLDFGAVDIIRSKRKNYVLEIGTAPGLSDIGVRAYGAAIILAASQERA
jgi:glutathione synthase/RimK-type ligase-like ATP-grasp enzyme